MCAFDFPVGRSALETAIPPLPAAHTHVTLAAYIRAGIKAPRTAVLAARNHPLVRSAKTFDVVHSGRHEDMLFYRPVGAAGDG